MQIGQFRFDSKVTGRYKIFESAESAVVPQTTLTVQQKNFNRCATVTCNWDLFYVYEYMIWPLHLQLLYNEACSRVVPGSMQSCYTTPVAIGIEHVNDYTLIQFES